MAEHASLTTRKLPFLCLSLQFIQFLFFSSHLKPKVMVTWQGWWWCFCGGWGPRVARTVIQTTCESITCLLPWLRSWQLTGSFSHSNNQWSERCVLHMKVNNSMNIYRKRWTILMWRTFAFLVVPPKPWILSTSPFLVYGSHPFPHNI